MYDATVLNYWITFSIVKQHALLLLLTSLVQKLHINFHHQKAKELSRDHFQTTTPDQRSSNSP